MSQLEILQNILLDYGLLFILGVGVLFLLLALAVVVFLWYTNRLPIKRYGVPVEIWGFRYNEIELRRFTKARVDVDAKGNRSLCLRRGINLPFGIGFSEITGVPIPSDEKITRKGQVRLLQRSATDYQPFNFRVDENDVNVDIDDIERTKQAFINAELERLNRNKENNILLQILPYGVIAITIVGAFLIVAVLAEPMIAISQQNVQAAAQYKEASEANLKIARLMNAGVNGTVPNPNPDEPPPS